MDRYFEKPQTSLGFNSNFAMIKFLFLMICVQVGTGASAQLKNIKLADWQDETVSSTGLSIAINHRDSKNLVVGFGSNRAFFTLDEGKTWNESKLDSSFGTTGGTA